MNIPGASPLHVDKTILEVGLIIVTALALLALWKSRFASQAETWPTTTARIENVFLSVNSRGPNRNDIVHVVLAYAYSIKGSYYSGQIKLDAGEPSLESVQKEMIGQSVPVHCKPSKPEVSIFLNHKVRGWMVVPDRRIL